MQRLQGLLGGVVLFLFAFAGAVPGDAPGDRLDEPSLNRNKSGDLTAVEIDDAEDFQPWVPDTEVAVGPAQTCETVSRDERPSTGSFRFVGNSFRFDQPATLEGFEMLLNYTGPAELNFVLLVFVPELGAYARVRDDIIVIRTGMGLRLYGTGLLSPPLTLEADRDYLLGVAWGNILISHRLDRSGTTVYPNEFSRGRYVQGSFFHPLNLNPDNQEPPVFVPEFGLTVGVDDRAANVIRLCFTPDLGACCCVGSGGCTPLTSGDCMAAGGFFRGERILCEDAGCTCGSCCFPCDEVCRNDYEQVACLSAQEGTTWQEEPCAEVDCPVRTGACCRISGCSEQCSATCTAGGGTFLGIGTTCFPSNPCRGACCIPVDPEVSGQLGRCEDLRRETCEANGGVPRPLGTSCATLSGTAECGGACCRGEFGCSRVGQREGCQFEFEEPGKYLGDATLCPDDRPGQNNGECDDPDFAPVACCMADGLCMVTTQGFCDAPWIRGVYVEGITSCDDEPCGTIIPLDEVACCYPDGTCSSGMNQPDCIATNGRRDPMNGSSCNPNPCTQPRGACCSAGTCTANLTETACTSPPRNGVYRGDNSTCPASFLCPTAPTGACCQTNDFCGQATEAECLAGGGTFHLDTPCSICPPLLGACCRLDGTCEQRTRTECEGLPNAEFLGDLVACTPGRCELPTGACCMLGGLCEELTEPQCLANEGLYSGNQTNCTETECPLTGACCVPTEPRCRFLVEDACEVLDGDFQGVGMNCPSDPPCPPPMGACCRPDGFCGVTTMEGCVNGGGVYQGDGMPCLPTLVCPAFGACCLSEPSCESMFDFQCQAQGGTFQGRDVVCNDNLCPKSCCLSVEPFCTDLVLPITCRNQGGTVLGEGVRCEADICPLACCFADGRECLVAPPALCTSQGGSTRRDSAVCDPDPCVRGCCFADERVCSVVNQSTCTAEGGTPQNYGVNCEPDPCERGCCLPNGQCRVIDEATCTMMHGEFNEESPTCMDLNCPIRAGACCLFNECMVRTRGECEELFGDFAGEGTDCEPNPCLIIVASEPHDGTVDARQPLDHLGMAPAGFDTIELRMTSDTSALTVADFSLTVATAPAPPEPLEPLGPPVVPSIESVVSNGNFITLHLSDPIPPGHWTQFTYVLTDSSICVGSLPGDSSGNGYVRPQAQVGDEFEDFDRLFECIMALECLEHIADLDRSGSIDLLDLVRFIDLVNGANGTTVWLGRSVGRSPCHPLGACCVEGACDQMTATECADAGGTFHGPGNPCVEDICLTIVGAVPDGGMVDARQPSEPDGSHPASIDVMLLFNGSTAGLTIDDFAVSVTGGGPAPMLTAINSNGTNARLQFIPSGDPVVPVGEWLHVVYSQSGAAACFAFLGGDVNGDGSTVAPQTDMDRLVDCLDGVGDFCEAHQCDLDRSGTCDPLDLMRGIDLFNGADVLEPTNGATLPETPCP